MAASFFIDAPSQSSGLTFFLPRALPEHRSLDIFRMRE